MFLVLSPDSKMVRNIKSNENWQSCEKIGGWGKNNTECWSFSYGIRSFLCKFGTTYLCEKTFSTMNYVKNKYRSTLIDKHLGNLLLLSTSKINPDIKKLINSIQVQKPRLKFHTTCFTNINMMHVFVLILFKFVFVAIKNNFN